MVLTVDQWMLRFRQRDSGSVAATAAVQIWKEWNPALILMDIHMPVMDGLEATRTIKADPRGKDTSIVILTASAMDDDRLTVFESGADDFLSKPCCEDELLESIRALLGVTYDYEEVVEEIHAVGGLLALGRLGQVSPHGNKRLLDNLILRVREGEDARSADALQELADKYEYQALIRLLEQACSG